MKLENLYHITEADVYTKETLRKILDEGCMDLNPRPHWEDGSPAHTISINHVVHKYDLYNGDCPFLTLRPTGVKSAIGEILWIYRDASNDLDMLKDKYGITWWDEWDIGDRTIGQCYGATVNRYNLLDNLIQDILENPDGRRHIVSLWQESDFNEKHGLKPCCYQTVWKIRRSKHGNLIDVSLFQRSSDFTVSGNINTLQYIALVYMVVAHLNYKLGKEEYRVGEFMHIFDNCQIYDKHIDAASKIIKRNSIEYPTRSLMPRFEVEPKNIYDMTVDDVQVIGYDRKKISEMNPQIKFEVAI